MIKSLYDYTRSSKQINEYLRNPSKYDVNDWAAEAIKSDLDKQVKNLDYLIGNGTGKGIKFSKNTKLYRFEESKFHKDYKIGDVIELKAFTSTSLSSKQTYFKGDKMIFYAKAGRSYGTYAGATSYFSSVGQEFLMARNTKIKFIKKDSEGLHFEIL